MEIDPTFKVDQNIETDKQPLIVIIGPTAVGKSEFSIQLAERLNGEIVSADSRLFYRGMDIGTAKPSADELSQIPHHLIDVTDPDQIWSLALYKLAAHQAISDIHKRNHLPILVGGTGQYIHAITDDWDIPAVAPNPSLRKILEDWAKDIGPLGLHKRLAYLDPQASGLIDYRNLRRTVRALEVIFSTGYLFSKQRRIGIARYKILNIGLNRPRVDLYDRIDRRIQAMLAAGFISEVQKLLNTGFSPDLPSLSAIGYREIILYIEGRISLEEAVRLIKRSTRIFVRRQSNWFKPSDPDIQWFNLPTQTIEDIESFIRSWIKTQID
jgi:tRNA dimethylallyltransferase